MDIAKAGIAGALMTLIVFGAYEIGYGGRYEWEFTRSKEFPPAKREARQARRVFLAVTGQKGIPDECELFVHDGGDPTDPRSYALVCDVIRMEGVER